ncbi:hypothetical protein CONCODRAFT_73478 [Conidiobolus coronatus NRRL 28638]|uniref:Uncharacterized protein n=1 Tax=Conidiobolus coronatus (strain ATCC 28846 / CBS 209.66 / NRRL 28638) TaxID=796925 RepID=A0A137NVB3_CONC2|nr:hypothetical protein CONCODRAFT_73478 [Conidiobolus coronatus NRRL 28638]|eukprot:KXN66707.1 hypothetical protein CONCODRAFT_73478 [Conidiobolus coronatus NRRL 28638]
MAIVIDTHYKKLTLSGAIRTLDNLLDNYYQNSYHSPLDTLNQFVGGVSQILSERCCYIYKKGKNKNMKCLRARLASTGGNYIGDKCGRHSPKELKNPKKTTIRKQPNADSAPEIISLDPLKNNSDAIKKFQIDIVDWNDPLPAPRAPLQKYYTNPDTELQHLYDNFYIDTEDILVLKNTKDTLACKWIFISKINRESGATRVFSETILAELNKQQKINHYDYKVDESGEYLGQVDAVKIVQALKYARDKAQNAKALVSNAFSSKTPNLLISSPNKSLMDPESYLEECYNNPQYLEAYNVWLRANLSTHESE